jgi:hypothetical protein
MSNEVFADRKYEQVNDEGKVTIRKAATDWIQWPARAVVDSVVYEPAAPVIVNGVQLNLWEGWGATPIEGDVSIFVKLIDHIFSTADPLHKQWFMQWLAYPLQHPGAKMNTACVLWSLTQGSGKSIIGYTMGKIYGVNYCEVNKEQLQDKFNGWAINRQFVMGEEITGGSGRDVADVLKNMITGREVTVNAKYVPTYTVRNCINYYFTSNHQDAFFLTIEDRRYFIHEILGAKLPDAFWKEYDKWFKSQEGINALFHYLLNLDLDGFNPAAEAPHTESRKQMIEAGLSEHAAWTKELREHPDNILRTVNSNGSRGVLRFALYTIEELLALYQPEDSKRTRRISPKGLANALKEAGFERANGGEAIVTGEKLRQRVWCIRNAADAEMSGADASKKYMEERGIIKADNAKGRKFIK